MGKETKRILIADDEELNRQTLSVLLEKTGYEVSSVPDGKTALEEILISHEKRELFDVLLTDVAMPEMSGIELIRELKKRNMDIPVVAITAYGDKDMLIELLRSGCSDYIEKPVQPEVVRDRIRKILETRESEPQWKNASRVYRTERYRMDDLETQVAAAAKAYRNLIHFDDGGYNVRAAFFCRSLSTLGGDFARIANTPNGCDILVADVSGHDMGASFHTVLIDSFFQEEAHRADGVAAFFASLNEKLLESGKEERMATAICLRLNLETMEVEAVSAGHPSFLKQDMSGSASTPWNPKGDVLGVFENAEFERGVFPISPGNRLFLYTDGVTNAYRVNADNGEIQRLGNTGLKKLIEKYHVFPIKESVARIGRDVLAFGGYALKDDCLLLGLEIPWR